MTQSFKQVLDALPDIEHIEKINLYDQNNNSDTLDFLIAVIPV